MPDARLRATSRRGPTPAHGAGPTQAELTNAGKNTDDVVTYGMSYNHNRYSPLRQINKSNVKRLVPVWNLSLRKRARRTGAAAGLRRRDVRDERASGPYAIDAVTGKLIWRTPVDYDADTPRVVCCGVSNKGVAIYEGKVFRTTLDAHVVALDQKTGKQVWKQKVAEWKEGYSLTVAPLVANGVLITGCSGAEFGARCFLDGWDPATGKKLWRRYTTAGPGEKGHETWEPRETLSARRREHVDHGLVRSGARSGLLGHRQRRPVEPRRSARATISTPPRSSRSVPRPARSPGTTRSRRTISGTGIPGRSSSATCE